MSRGRDVGVLAPHRGKTAVALAAILCTGGGTCFVSCSAVAKGNASVKQASPPEATSIPAVAPTAEEPSEPCDAGSLPRFDESKFRGGKSAIVTAASRGTVAVTWDEALATVVEDCHLPSAYRALEARRGNGTFYAVGRVFFRPDEIPEACRRATHLVAALATWDEHASVVLLPLACPSVSDEKPAAGCVGRGKTGRQRGTAAERLITGPPLSQGDTNPGARLGAWALAPDSSLGLRPLFYMQGDELSRRSRWLVDQYNFEGVPETATATAHLRPPPKEKPPSAPTMRDGFIDHPPLFHSCFLPHVDPKFANAVIF